MMQQSVSMNPPSRRSDRALEHLDAVAAAREALAEAYDTPHTSRDRIGQLHQTINFGLKFAEVHALIAIGDQLEDLNRTQAEDRGIEYPSGDWA